MMIDKYILLGFTKISQKVCELTGRTNFFLAKIACSLYMLSLITKLIGFWFPVLDYQPRIIIIILCSMLALCSIVVIINCDKAEQSLFSNNPAKHPDSMAYKFWWRLIFVGFGLIDLLDLLTFSINSSKGLLIPKILDHMFSPAFAMYYYFISVDPIKPCRGLIKKWIESFVAGFRKQAPVKN